MIYSTLLILLQDAAEPGIFSPTSLIFASLIMLTFWFFIIRPQSKKIKDQNQFIEELGKGNKVVTMGGVHGKIVKESEHTYLVEIDSNTKIKINKTAISKELTAEFYGDKSESK